MRWLGWALACGAPPASPTPPAELPPNVLLIVADDLGIDQVSAWGLPGAPPTPHLDALAARGVRFETAWGHPSCSPSRAALLTGRHPRRFGLGRWIDPPLDRYGLPEEERTLPEALAAADPPWETALVGKWHLTPFGSPEAATAPLRHGFHHHDGSLANLRNALGAPSGPLGYDRWEKAADGALTVEERYAPEVTVADAARRMATLREPWLLVVAPNLPHAPLHTPPPPWWESPAPEGPLETFEAMVVATDAVVGALLAALPPDRAARTVVIVTSDNGTPSHGLRPPLDPERGKETPYEPGVRVPLIVAGPGVATGVSRAPAHLVDLFPTVAELAGLSPGGAPLDGVSLWPTLRDPSAPTGREWLYAEHFAPNGPPPYGLAWAAVRDERFKLVDRDGVEEWYDLGAGWVEGADLRGTSDPAVVARIAALRAELIRRRAGDATRR